MIQTVSESPNLVSSASTPQIGFRVGVYLRCVQPLNLLNRIINSDIQKECSIIPGQSNEFFCICQL